MISYSEAKKLLTAEGHRVSLQAEKVALTQAMGRICAGDVCALMPIPAFDNSAMDGYAVRLADLMTLPAMLKIDETIAAGDRPKDSEPQAGSCAAIMTGAVLPTWAEAVIPVEAVSRQEGQAMFTQSPAKGDHIRRMGEDFKKGDKVISAGTRIGASHIMALAALGHDTVEVQQKIKTCFLATGKELAPAGSSLQLGQIHNSNLPYALSVMPGMGMACTLSQTIADDDGVFAHAINNALRQECRLIVSSGAVSAGAFDFVRKTLEELGAEIFFHKVAIKPGKPVLFARFKNGAYYFGLPGNPLATAAGLRFFVQPFLDACFKTPEEMPLRAVLDGRFVKKNSLRMFLKAHMQTDETGKIRVRLLDGQESFRIKPFTLMNAWAVIPEQADTLENGAVLDLYMPEQQIATFY